MFNSLQTGVINEVEFSQNFPLHRACRDGDLQLGKLLLQTELNLVCEDHYNNWNPCHWAAFYGKCDSLRQVIAAFPNLINSQSSKTCQTPLHCAAQAGHSHCVLWLLQAGSNPNVKDNYDEIALHKACRIGNAECVDMLVSASSNISVVNNIGQSPSVVANTSGHMMIANHVRSKEAMFGVDKFWEISNNQPNLSFSGLRRKRNHDFISGGTAKRICIGAPITENSSVEINGVFNFMLSPITTGSSSMMEHETLCKVDQGYTNSILDLMIHDYHGC